MASISHVAMHEILFPMKSLPATSVVLVPVQAAKTLEQLSKYNRESGVSKVPMFPKIRSSTQINLV